MADPGGPQEAITSETCCQSVRARGAPSAGGPGVPGLVGLLPTQSPALAAGLCSAATGAGRPTFPPTQPSAASPPARTPAPWGGSRPSPTHSASVRDRRPHTQGRLSHCGRPHVGCSVCAPGLRVRVRFQGGRGSSGGPVPRRGTGATPRREADAARELGAWEWTAEETQRRRGEQWPSCGSGQRAENRRGSLGTGSSRETAGAVGSAWGHRGTGREGSEGEGPSGAGTPIPAHPLPRRGQGPLPDGPLSRGRPVGGDRIPTVPAVGGAVWAGTLPARPPAGTAQTPRFRSRLRKRKCLRAAHFLSGAGEAATADGEAAAAAAVGAGAAWAVGGGLARCPFPGAGGRGAGGGRAAAQPGGGAGRGGFGLGRAAARAPPLVLRSRRVTVRFRAPARKRLVSCPPP